MADQVLQDIKDRLDIAEVIGGYIQIKKSGANYKAVCPFHNEKSASLMISPQKQIWHCFGCGEGGDIFGFVMRYENLEFRDVLKLLADRAGVKLPEYRPRDPAVASLEEQLYKINDFAARFYHEILVKDKRGAAAISYLKKRGVTSETIAKWKIGFAPDEFHALEQALVKKGVSLENLVKAGVSVRNERGQLYDRFRGRITFPIFNAVGEVVGFSARILIDDGKSAKYINSPETAIYNKSKVLFGFNFAKNDIRKKDEAIIVEGQMDCISPHQAGITNVVASSGTALTLEQLTQIGRLTKNLKFCFDADAAGLMATKRAIGQYLGKDFIIKIITLTDAKDPDELVRKNPKLFEKAVADAVLFLDFYIAKAFEGFRHTVEEKKRIAKELLPLLASLSDPIEQDHYVKLLAEKLDTIPSVLVETLHKLPKAGAPKVAQPASATKKIDAPTALEKQVLGGMLLFPQFKAYVGQQSSAQDFTHLESKTLADRLFKNIAIDEDNLLAKEAIFMVESQLADMEGGEPALERELKKALAMLRLAAIKQEQKHLHEQMKAAEGQQAKDELAQLSQQFANLSKQRLEFEKLL